MNAYLLLPLLLTLFCLVLVVMTIRGNTRSYVHRLFSFFLLTLGAWGVVIFGMRASSDLDSAYGWERWAVPLAALMSTLLYHFSVEFTVARVKPWILTALYLASFLCIPLALTRYIIVGMQIKPYGYAPIYGWLSPPWILFNYVVPIAALVAFIRYYRRSTYAEQRNRVVYIIIGLCLIFIGGIFDILPSFGLPLYPGAIIADVTFCSLVAMAIIKHNLLDIRVVLRKGVAYFLTSTLFSLPFIIMFFVTTVFVPQYKIPPWAYFVLLAIAVVVLPQVWAAVQRNVDRWFYRDRYDHLRALDIFNKNTQSLINDDTQRYTLVKLVAGALRAKSVFLLQPNGTGGDFVCVASFGSQVQCGSLAFNKDSYLLKWLEKHTDPLPYHELDFIPQLQGAISEENGVLEQVQGKVIVPLKTVSGRLSGLFVLGSKLSEQPYTLEERKFVSTISNQVAMSLENARLYDDAQRARRNLEAWLNSMSDCVIIVQFDRTIQFMNKAARDTFPEGAPRCWGALGRDSACPQCPIPNLTDTSHGISYTSLIGDRQYDVAAAALKNPDGSLALIEVLRDVTEREQARMRERQLQQELGLASRLASIGELAAGVAHEINNPLTGIMGFSERVLRKSTDETVKRDLQRIYDEACRAARVVDNLRTFARRRHPKKESISVNDILQKTLEMRMYELRTSNIEVEIDLNPSLPNVRADFQQMQQVFLNIIINAEQAMSEAKNGRKLRIQSEGRDGFVRIILTDSGPGISEENLSKLFQPFFTTRGDKGGTGLGLSICHGIVSEHGGKIYARSEAGKGAEFFVELPTADEMAGQ